MANKKQFTVEDSVRLSEIRQYLVEHWRAGSGNCMSCPMNCSQLLNENLQSEDGDPVRLGGEEMPDFAAINPNAPIMMVNNTPNYSGNNEYRPYTPTEQDSVPKSINQVPYFWSDAHSKTEDGDDPRDRYTYHLIEDWPDVSEPMQKLVQRGNNDEITWRSFYYTNSVKCTEFDNSSIDSKARRLCVNWLEWEISTIVNPDIIITGGPHATASTLAAIEHQYEFKDNNIKNSAEIERAGTIYSGQRPQVYIRNSVNNQMGENKKPQHPYIYNPGYELHIIPIPQFSMAATNGTQGMKRSDYAFDMKYYDFLYETISGLL